MIWNRHNDKDDNGGMSNSQPVTRSLEYPLAAKPAVTAMQKAMAEAGHPLFRHEEFCGTVRYYDTFDWRLYQHNLELIRHEHRYQLRDRTTGQVVTSFAWQRKHPLRFSRDFNCPEESTRFYELIEQRALVEKLAVHRETTIFSPLPLGQEATLRIVVEAVMLKNSDPQRLLRRVIRLEQTKGRRREFQSFSSLLEKYLGIKGEESVSLLDSAVAELDPAPGSYSTRITTPLLPSMTCREAAVLLCRDIFSVMRANEPGLLADLDVEFLHDYRVSVRRLRSLLSQLKAVFPEPELAHFSNEFAVLGRFTNHLRDCDVLLENRPHYERMLPESLRRGLVPFFKNIAATRRQEQRRLTEYLRSGHYRDLCLAWTGFLDRALTLPETANAGIPIIEMAGKMIIKRFRRVIKQGRAITDTSHDNELHSLRIACKKLRYLMEFFSPLYEDRLEAAIDTIKKIQSNLGDFNDLAIQIERLDNRIRRSSPHHPNSLLTAAAVGGLIAMLAEQKFRLRDEFDNVFAVFSRQDNRTAFEDKFGACPSTAPDKNPPISQNQE